MQKRRWMDTSIFPALSSLTHHIPTKHPSTCTLPSNPESPIPPRTEWQSTPTSTVQVLPLPGHHPPPQEPLTHSDNRDPRMRLLEPRPTPPAPSSPGATRWAYAGVYRSQSRRVSQACRCRDSLVKLTASAIRAVRLSGFSSRHLFGPRGTGLVSATLQSKPRVTCQLPPFRCREIPYWWVINKVTDLRKETFQQLRNQPGSSK